VSTFKSAYNFFDGVPDWADGKWIPASELLECVQLGDIIQFKLDWKIYTHFAIYVGDGFIVHISKENAVIRVHSITSTDWKT
jgi:cell wall-associated NlpC family hydrolase